MRAGLLEHARNSRHVLGGVEEHGQIHRRLAHAVVVHEVLLESGHHLLHVGDLIVQTVAPLAVGFAVAHEIAEHAVPELLGVHRSVAVLVQMSEELVEVLAKVRLRELLDVLQKPRSVLVVHQAVVEHPQSLVHPQAVVLADAAQTRLDALRLLQGETLHHAADVAKVKGVVRLGGGGEQLADGGIIHVQGSRDDRLLELLDILRELLGLVEPREDRAEDVLERLAVKLHDGEQVVVPLIPLRDGRSPAAGGTHCRHKQAVLHVPEVILPVVPAPVVHVLPQELDRGLSAVNLLLWHVQVVHHDRHAFSDGRPVVPLASLVQLGIDEVLGDVGGGLRGEPDKVWRRPLLLVHAHEVTLHVNGLASAGGSAEEDRVVVLDGQICEEEVPDRVHGRNDDLLESHLGWDGGLVDIVLPRHPLALGHVPSEVVNRGPGRDEVTLGILSLDLVRRQRRRGGHVPLGNVLRKVVLLAAGALVHGVIAVR